MSSLPQPLPPVPVQPIGYSTPVSNRPGIITAIGVISIVVGSLGLLFNGIAGLQAFGMVMISSISNAAVARQAAVKNVHTGASASAKTTPANPANPADPMSMPAADRQTVVRGLMMHRSISKPRRDQLDALLAKTGRQIFKLRGSDLTVDIVKQNVSEAGQLPDAKGGEGPDFFVIGEGRIELADDHALFAPGDGRETVRVNASEDGEQENWEAGLTPAQVKGIIDKIEQQAGMTLSDAVKSKLDATFSAPGQGYFETAATIPEVTGQITNVSYFTNNGVGQLMVSTPQGMLSLDMNGNVISSNTWGGGGGAGPFAAGAPFKVNMTAAVTAMTSAVLSVALAIFLLVIGILMLRQHPRAGMLHKLYAWIKIPVAIMGGIAWVMLWTSIMRGAIAAAPGASTPAATGAVTTAVVTGSVIAIVVGCLYPVSLLIALRSKAVREYYAAVT